MVQDTWHIVSSSRGAMCHVQNESNMSSSGAHEIHMESCYWKEIHGRCIRDECNPRWPMRIGHLASKRTPNLDLSSPKPVWEGKEERERGNRKREGEREFLK